VTAEEDEYQDNETNTVTNNQLDARFDNQIDRSSIESSKKRYGVFDKSVEKSHSFEKLKNHQYMNIET
jgi:hypothetical protein